MFTVDSKQQETKHVLAVMFYKNLSLTFTLFYTIQVAQ